jgi:hypothetical protein
VLPLAASNLTLPPDLIVLQVTPSKYVMENGKFNILTVLIYEI